MPTFNEFFPSKYWKAADVADKPVLLHIKLVMMETIGQPGKQERKPIMHFTNPDGSEVMKALVLNVTNGKTVQKLYGDDIAAWEGKPIVLDHAVVDVRGEQKEAIRLRAPKAKPEEPEEDIPF